MWRRSIFNTVSSFGRQLLISSLDKPMSTSLSQVTRTLNINNNCRYYYYSVVSPNNIHHQTRFMSNDTSMMVNNNGGGGGSSSSNDNEIVNHIYSMMVNYNGGGGGGCCSFDTIAESSEEHRKTLLSHSFFLKMMDDPPEDITDDTWDAYFNWVFGRDDFNMNNRILTEFIHAFTSSYVSQRGGADNFLYSLWSMMQRRRVQFKTDGVVTTQLLNRIFISLSFSSLLRKVDHSITSLRILDLFPELGCVPDLESYKWIAFCCARLDKEDPRVDRLCRDMCDFIRTHPTVDDGCVSQALGLLLSVRQLKLAHAIYVAAKDRFGPSQLLLEKVFYLIRLLSYKDDKSSLCLALDMLADLSPESRSSKGSGAAFSAVVLALCTKHNDVHAARKLVGEMVLKGPPPGIKAFNALVKSLCLSGDLEGAFEVLRLAESRGLKPDLGSYRLLIKGYKKRGMMDQASRVMSMATHKYPSSTIKVQLA